MFLTSGLRGVLYSKVPHAPEVPMAGGNLVQNLGAERGSVRSVRHDVLYTGSRLVGGAKRWAA